MDDQRGLVDRAGASACCWRPQKGGCGSRAVPAHDGEELGRSRGGLTTKNHMSVDGRARPLSIPLTGGQASDNPLLLPVLDAIAVKHDDPGRPCKRPDMRIADKAYAHPSTRQALRQRRIRHTIPERSDQIAQRAAKGADG